MFVTRENQTTECRLTEGLPLLSTCQGAGEQSGRAEWESRAREQSKWEEQAIIVEEQILKSFQCS